MSALPLPSSDGRSSLRHLSITFGQLLWLVPLLGLGAPVMLITLDQAAVSAAVLLLAVALGGLWLCGRLQHRLADPKLAKLGELWLIKLVFLIFLCYVGWMPELAPFSTLNWGVDYQRFYWDAQYLIENDWSTNFVSLNYTGVLYYYAGIFFALGRNPVIPALINALVTLLAALYLIKTAYDTKPQRGPRDWMIALVLVMPELLWFDVVTSREMLMAAAVLVSTLAVGRMLAGLERERLGWTMLLVALCILAIAAVRTGMVMAVCVASAVMIFFIQPANDPKAAARMSVLRLPLMGAMILVPIATQGLAALLGGYEFDLGGRLEAVTAASSEAARHDEELTWSQNSIGLLLVPSGPVESVLLLVPRMILYLVAPLPDISVPIADLLAGNMIVWQKLFMLGSSALNVMSMPFALAAAVSDFRQRRKDARPLMLHIACWVIFAAVAGGNIIIHERYRTMATMLLWACTWRGIACAPRGLVSRIGIGWFGGGALGALAILAYKAN